MQVKLTIGERLKDLRVAKKLTLEQLSTEVGISKSALGKYESDNGKDISPYSISMLADYYGVSSDYLMGRTETKNHPNTALHELHLSDASIDIYTFTSFSGQSDFAAQKSCDCAVAHITKSACPAAAKKRLLPHSAAPQSTPPTPLPRQIEAKVQHTRLSCGKSCANRDAHAPIGNPAAKGRGSPVETSKRETL